MNYRKGWSQFAVYLVTKGGEISALCPIVAKHLSINARELLEFAEDISEIESTNNRGLMTEWIENAWILFEPPQEQSHEYSLNDTKNNNRKMSMIKSEESYAVFDGWNLLREWKQHKVSPQTLNIYSHESLHNPPANNVYCTQLLLIDLSHHMGNMGKQDFNSNLSTDDPNDDLVIFSFIIFVFLFYVFRFLFASNTEFTFF